MARICLWTSTVLLGLATLCLAAETSREGFFRPAPDRAQAYDPEKIYPQGRIFPYGFYAAGAARAKQDGVTLLGPYGTDENVAQAKKYGLKCTYTIGLKMDFLGEKPLRLSTQEIENRIRQQVLGAMDHPEIAWWYLRPEEMRHWRDNEMEYLAVAARTIRQTDPLRRPVWMYDPGHRDAKSLAHTVRHLDICGKGMYTNYTGYRDSRIWVRWSIEQEIGAIKQANRSAIPLAVPEMFLQPPEELLPTIPRWVRHDVYLGLITGAKGVMVFSGFARPNFDAHAAYYEAYASVGRELGGRLNLGPVFLFGEVRDDIQVSVVDGPAQVALEDKQYPSVSFRNIAYGKDRYLFLVNSAAEAVSVVVDGLPPRRINAEQLFPPGRKFIVGERNFELSLESLGVQAFRFSVGE